MRVFLWLFGAPTIALLALSLTGPLGPMPAVGAALAGQALAFPCWQRLERRRLPPRHRVAAPHRPARRCS